MNICQEFTVKFNHFSPSDLFFILNNYSQSPFASFYKVNHNYCLCSSPERYIRKKNNKVISQPIKGTGPRSRNLHIDDDNKKIIK